MRARRNRNENENEPRQGGASASKKLLAAIAVLAVAFAVFAAIPAVDATEGNAAEATEVASFDALKSAVAIDNFNVKLTNNVEITEYLSVVKTGVLDLNGKTVSRSNVAWAEGATSNSTITVGVGGNLTINDSSADKAGAVIGSNTLSHAAALAVINGGACTINGGTFELVAGAINAKTDVGGWYTIVNEGSLTIKNGTFVGRQLTGDGSSMIKSGWYDGNAQTKDGNDLAVHTGNATATLTIDGGVFKFGLNTVKNDDYGVLVINGGTFSNTSQAVVMNNNVATINGGTFNASKQVIVPLKLNDTSNQGITNINGGTFDVKEGYYVVEMNRAQSGATLGEVNIKAGAIDGPIVGFKVGDRVAAGSYAGTVKIGNNAMTFSGILPGTKDIVISEGSVEITGTLNAGTVAAKIAAAGGDVVLKDLTITAGNLTLDKEITVKGTLTVDAGAKVIVDTNAKLNVEGTVKTNEGATAGTTAGAIENKGQIVTGTGANIADANITNSENGQITNNADDSEMSEVTVGGISDAGTTVFTAKNIVTVNKSWTLINGSDVTINGKLVIPEGATLTIQSGAKLTLDNNAVFEIEGTLVIEEAEEGAPAEWGLIVKMGEVRISNNVTVNGPVDVQANGKLTIGQDGTLIIGTEGSLKTIAGSKVTVDASGTLQVNGQFDGATIYNKGTVIINTDKAATADTTVIQGADGAVVDVVKYTVQGGSSAKLTVKDDEMVFTTYRNGSSSVNVTIGTNNSVEIAPVVSITAATGSEEDSVAANYNVAVSGLKVVSGVSTEATTATGNDGENGVYNQKQYSKTLDVAGAVSVSAAYAGEGTAASTITSTAIVKFNSAKDVDDKGKSSIAVSGALELQSGVTVDNANGTLAVTGTVVAQTGAEYKNTASGAAKITGEGEISNVKALSSVTATEYVTKAKDSTGKEVSTYHYVNIDKALAVLSAEGSAVKYAKLMADQTVTADATVPEGATLDISNCKLTVGKAGKDTALTFANGSILKGAAAGTITVNGVLKALNKSNVKVADEKITSDVKTEQVDENGKPVKNGWVQWTNVTAALNGAESGSTVTVTGTEVKISANTNVKDGVTLVVPSGSTLLLQPGITLTIDGILKLDGDIKAPAFDLTAMNLTATVNKYSSTIVVNGTLMSSAPIAYGNGTTSTSKDATSSILAVDGVAPIAGAYYSMDGYYVISSVAVAQSNAAKIENYLITIHGKVNAGDVSFTGTDNFNKIIVSADATTSASIASPGTIGTAFTFSSLALTGVEFEIASTGTAGYATGSLVFGDVSLVLKDVTGLKAKVADSKVVLDGTVDLSKTGASFAVSKGTAYTAAAFTVTIGSEKKNTFTVSADAVLEAGANNTGAIASLTVDGVLSVPTGKGMTVTNLKVNGTVNVDAATLTSVAGNLSVTNATIGDVGKTKVGAVATFNGPIATSGVVIISSAAVVDDAFTASLPMTKTEYYVDGKVWFTAYGSGSVTPGKIPVDNVKPAGWSKTEGGAAEKNGDNIRTSFVIADYDKLYALYETQVYKIVVKADEGIADVYLNGQAMVYGLVNNGESGYYYAYSATVAAGDYKVTYTLKNGWSGDAKLAGDNVSGMSFKVSGDYSADKVYQLSGIEKSGYVDPTPAPSEDKDDGLTITDYLLIVLVVLIVILAVIVAMRLMRS